MKTKWLTDLHGQLNESEVQVLLENGVPKTTEKATNFEMVGKMTKHKKKHFKYNIFPKQK